MKVTKFSFAVGRGRARRSSLWTIVVPKKGFDLYLMSGDSKDEKFSIHQSGKRHVGFSSDGWERVSDGVRDSLNQRRMRVRWEQHERIDGLELVVRVHVRERELSQLYIPVEWSKDTLMAPEPYTAASIEIGVFVEDCKRSRPEQCDQYVRNWGVPIARRDIGFSRRVHVAFRRFPPTVEMLRNVWRERRHAELQAVGAGRGVVFGLDAISAYAYEFRRDLAFDENELPYGPRPEHFLSMVCPESLVPIGALDLIWDLYYVSNPSPIGRSPAWHLPENDIGVRYARQFLQLQSHGKVLLSFAVPLNLAEIGTIALVSLTRTEAEMIASMRGDSPHRVDDGAFGTESFFARFREEFQVWNGGFPHRRWFRARWAYFERGKASEYIVNVDGRDQVAPAIFFDSVQDEQYCF